MKKSHVRRLILTIIIAGLIAPVMAQQSSQAPFETKNIKSDFGAAGNGKTNDNDAFGRAAAYFNHRGGNGRLVIPKGIYIVGKQVRGTDNLFDPQYVLALRNVVHLAIDGDGAKLKYIDSLYYGSFDPVTLKPFQPTGYFTDHHYAAYIGTCVDIESCSDVTVTGLELDGNNRAFKIGGSWGDAGIQLNHIGVGIWSSKDITIDRLHIHHFGQDGIETGTHDSLPQHLVIKNTVCEYNFRQGLSWIGGNGILVSNCAFNHTGRGRLYTAPGAGLDIESEWSPCKFGVFNNCEFTDNSGCGMVADSGPTSDMQFSNCLFWGTSTWSIWPNKPRYHFTGCNIFGSIVHTFQAQKAADGTTFSACHFQDSAYHGQDAYGHFLAELNGTPFTRFEACTFTARKAQMFWLAIDNKQTDQYYRLDRCRLYLYAGSTHQPYPQYIARVVGVTEKDCVFHQPADGKNYWYDNCCDPLFLIDAGGNQHLNDLPAK